MHNYSDPTASMAIGNINREFTKQVKKAKQLSQLYREGKLSAADLEKARSQFKGIYRNVLDNALNGEHN